MISKIDPKTDRKLFSDEAEMSVLGCMFLDQQTVPDVLDVIGKEDFASAQHAEYFHALQQLWNENKPYDMTHLVAKLRLNDQEPDVNYLIEIAEGVASPSSAKYYAELVKEASQKRRLLDAAHSIQQAVRTESKNVDEQIDDAEAKIFKIAQESSKKQEPNDLPTILDHVYWRLENGENRAIASGFAEIDHLTTGFRPGELIILAARPSMGKTTLGMNIAENVCFYSDMPVGFLSLEMDRKSLGQRLICSQAGVSLNKLRRNQLDENDFLRLKQAKDRMANSRFYIDFCPGASLTQIRAKARRFKQKHDIQFLVIDYLSLIKQPFNNKSTNDNVAEISRGLKCLAGELDMPVICLSQLNRGNTHREDKRPNMSDLRDSGAIEQDADMILMIHRESYYKKTDEAWMLENKHIINQAEVIVEKNRNGRIGVAYLHFNGDTTKFSNWADEPTRGVYR